MKLRLTPAVGVLKLQTETEIVPRMFRARILRSEFHEQQQRSSGATYDSLIDEETSQQSEEKDEEEEDEKE